ncbi:hypothetical protein BK666_07155 [Pseudomonas frederiksbergensis]|uniref:DUF3077 domain-containing protein n=1 Tax=Pseudomonas frederiksbergensis TaxID=104087 RepID=A0A423KBC5_9PSED|nr:DUF6124 family protein [Pseudomonas frederiksbergensis]RON49346.1 hypothetical protein BK666_07155 [Pseudomonas frederiksbergensis]
MIKDTPNPPGLDGETDAEATFTSSKPAMAERRPSPIFTTVPDVDNETLLVHACETLASACVMASELAFLLSGPKRNLALAIEQMAALAELSVNRVLDNVDPQG